MEQSIATVLETVADAIPNTAAVAQDGCFRSWAELDDRSSRLAAFLAGCGVSEGSVVAIGLQNRIEHVEAILAVAKLRAVPANLNYRYREAEIEYLLNDCSAVAVIAEPDVAERVVAVRSRTPALSVVVVPGRTHEQPSGVVGVESAVAECEPARRVTRSGDDHFIIYTGGTTGMPKATYWRQSALGRHWDNAFAMAGTSIPITLDELATSVEQLAAAPPRSITLPACPLTHATALHTAMGALVSGGLLALTPVGSFDPAQLWRTVERHAVTSLVIVGDAFARPLLDELRSATDLGHPHDVSSISRIMSSGVTWSADVKAGLLEFVDASLLDILASSEGGPYAISETRRGNLVPTSRFTLAPGARVIDEDGNVLEPGSPQVGFLASCHATPEGYLGDEVKSAATFRTFEGVRWSVPGDRATLESDGSLILLGRDSSIINTGGEKVFAEEVENALVLHPSIADAVVAPTPDERWGSVVSAVVQTTTGAPLAESELSLFLDQHLAAYKRPRRYHFVPEIRRSPAGKADRTWATALVTGDPVGHGAPR